MEQKDNNLKFWLFSLVAALGLFVAFRYWLLAPDVKKTIEMPQSALITAAPPAPPVSDSSVTETRLPQPLPDSSSLFTELASQRVTPSIEVTNSTDTTIVISLTGVDQGYSMQFAVLPDARLERDVQVGSFDITVSALDNSVMSNSGSAVFHQYRKYKANFVTVPASMSSPLRVGD